MSSMTSAAFRTGRARMMRKELTNIIQVKSGSRRRRHARRAQGEQRSP